MIEINKLALRAHYERHKDSYIEARFSGESSKWDEDYKWEVLPRLNENLAELGPLSTENALEIVELLQKKNPNNGSFCHWIDLDNLHNQLERKPVVSKALSYLWDVSLDTVGDEINSVNNLLHAFFSGEFKLSPSTFGYILSARDCGKFAIYREALLKYLVDLNSTQKPGNQGEKYQLLNDSAQYIGSLMAKDKDLFRDKTFYPALNGQDFLYVTLVYPNENSRIPAGS